MIMPPAVQLQLKPKYILPRLLPDCWRVGHRCLGQEGCEMRREGLGRGLGGHHGHVHALAVAIIAVIPWTQPIKSHQEHDS